MMDRANAGGGALFKIMYRNRSAQRTQRPALRDRTIAETPIAVDAHHRLRRLASGNGS
jgi:hypothetical protein